MNKRIARRIGMPLGLLSIVLSVFPMRAHIVAPPAFGSSTDWQHRRQVTASPSESARETQAIPQYQALFEGESIRIRPVVETDPDGYNYSMVTAPASSNWNAATATWTWTTRYLDIGAHRVTFRATDRNDPTNTIDFTTRINVYPDMTPLRWEKYDPDLDGLADPVMVAEPDVYPWEADTVRDPTIAVYAETGLPYRNQNGEYMMYYTGGSSTGASGLLYQTGLATSTDLIHWTKYEGNPVLRYGPRGAWDHEKVVPGSVLVMPDGTFRMYYSATGGGVWGWPYRSGLATSDDGIHWDRYSGKPILDIGPNDNHMVLDYAIKIGPTDWIMMYEISGTGHGGLVCALATSSDDGWTWTKASLPDYYALIPSPGQWDSGHVANPKPMKLGQNMYLVGYNGASSSEDYKLGIAVSFDGIHWHKYAGNPILVGDGDGLGDGYRIEGIQWLKDQFGQNHMDAVYFGGDARGPHRFRIMLATMDIPTPLPSSSPTYITRATIYEDFSSPQPIVNDVTLYTVYMPMVLRGSVQSTGTSIDGWR